MVNTKKYKKISPLVTRIDYSKFELKNFEEPNLLEIQKSSFERFLKLELKALFELYFPITHEKNKKYKVEFAGVKFVESKNAISEQEALAKGKSYEKAIYADLTLVNNESGDVDVAKKTQKNVSSGIFFGNIPMITSSGTFIVNGVEKNVLSQIVRSPGLYVLSQSRARLSAHAHTGYFCELLANRGTLIHFYNTKNNVIKCSIRISTKFDKSKEFTVTSLLKALGMTEAEIIRVFNNDPSIINSLANDTINVKTIFQDKLIRQFRDPKDKTNNSQGLFTSIRSYLTQYTELEKSAPEQAKAVMDKIISEWTAKNFIDELEISTRAIENEVNDTNYQEIFSKYLFTIRSYDLSGAGRYKLNRKFQLSDRLNGRIIAQDLKTNSGTLFKAGQLILKEELDKIKDSFVKNELDVTMKFDIDNKFAKPTDKVLEKIEVYIDNNSLDKTISVIAPHIESTVNTLTIADIISIISYTIGLQHDIGDVDDIEHIGNKRLRLIHEQLRQKLAVGMNRVEKAVKEKLSSLYSKTASGDELKKLESRATIKNVINTKHFQAAIKTFFNTYQLTQFLDQQNPLSELSAKRRISAMGEGGVNRDDPNLEIRDIHYSQYGRVCPIESPEGLSVGLVLSLAAYSRIDSNGFIQTPYFKVDKSTNRITDTVEWLTALKEDEHVVAHFDIPHNPDGKITVDFCDARYRGQDELIAVNEIDYVGISPKQILSISAGLIPFIESDEGHRAEMASNMQRQALPLILPHAPSVGTGNEYRIAHDSLSGLLSEEDGKVTYVDSEKITVNNKIHHLSKFARTNQRTCRNHTPIVNVGDEVKVGDVLADGPAMNNGELALGQNMLIGFIAWNGYNFEDAIVISERVVHEDLYTTVTIEEHVIASKKTKNGDEEITRDLPNVAQNSIRYLDEDGIITIGAEVKEGDVLVGKTTPKGQVDLDGEEKLLQALFGSKSKNVRDTSLRVPHGGDGIVCNIQRLTAPQDILADDEIEFIKVFIAQKRKLQIGDKLSGRHGNKGVVSIVVPVEDMPHLEDGTPLDVCLNPQGIPARLNIGQVLEVHLGLALRTQVRITLLENLNDAKILSERFGLNINKVNILVKTVKSYIKENGWAENEAIDKFNVADLAIVLKKVGLSIEDLNIKAQTPVFNGADANDIQNALKDVNINVDENHGKFKLIDGRTGEYFDRPVTVGVMYLLKLDHMVDDKIHARAIGPYSRVTQQPLGGKSQNGGQRCGEMEVWALEAHGAAYNIRELMTIKSDDVVGKRAAYSAIINHREIPQPNIPDAFKLLTKILQGLCLKITVETDKGNHADFDEFARTIEETMQIFSGATETKVAEIESSKYNESEALNSTVSKTEGSKGE